MSTLVGRVVSNTMRKTVKVAVDRFYVHPKVKTRIVRETRNLLAHDENQVCFVGDVVRIQQSPPISKLKKYVVTQIERPVKKFHDPDSGITYTETM